MFVGILFLCLLVIFTVFFFFFFGNFAFTASIEIKKWVEFFTDHLHHNKCVNFRANKNYLHIMLPLSLLRTAQNHPMLVELKNGETYNGHLVNCDNWMNINLREVQGPISRIKPNY